MDANIEKLLNDIIKICTNFADVDEIILYGSRAKGTHLPKSDIDIALKGYNLAIDELIEQIDEIETLLGIDLVDINNCKNDLLKKEVEKYGITLYRKV